jgi:predicted transcriptional regulator
MQEILRKNPDMESNEINLTDQTGENSISELMATLKNVKIEEEDLLIQRKKLQETENDLRSQAMAEIDEKQKRLKGLKSEIVYLQKKCNELKQALGIPVYE